MPFCHARLAGPKPKPAQYPRELRTLGDHLRAKRLDMKTTIREVAVTLGVTAETLRGWEHDAHEPSFRQFPAVFSFLGYDPFPEPGSLREQLRRVRMRRGWRQCDLAEALGVDPGTVAGWEAGAHQPTRKWRAAIESLVDSSLGVAERRAIPWLRRASAGATVSR